LKISLDFSSLLSDSINSVKSTDQSSNKDNTFKSIIKSFGDIIEQYDHQKLLSASGFGAIFPDNESTDYYELNKSNKYFENIEELIESYEQILKSVKPIPKCKSLKNVNFEPTINRTLEWIEQIQKNERDKDLDYFILLIITSEVNCEMLKTLDLVIDKTYSKPISIVVIDVNNVNLNEKIEDFIYGLTHKKKVDSRNNFQVFI